MKSKEIRKRFLDFYRKRGHAIIPSSSLLPEKDSTLLFVNSGMFPLVPYLLGEKHPEGKRIANSQKCFRSDDIEDVGNMRHTTFFEMLGNWSLGDYFKEEQLEFVFHFFTKELSIDPKRLYVSVYRGNEEIGIERDKEAVEKWKEIFRNENIEAKDIDFAEEKGMQGGRIFYYPDEENWWSRAGLPKEMPLNEPGGPDSEIFYDLGEELGHHDKEEFKDKVCHINCDCGRFIEIGNSVFMEFIKKESGFEKLPQKNVDFGGGLERITMICQEKTSIFETDLFLPIIKRIERLSGLSYRDKRKSFEVIADHLKAATHIIGDERGIGPSNKEQGYFVRRLIRRAVRHGNILGIDANSWLKDVAKEVVDIYKETYPEIEKNSKRVYNEIEEEEKVFYKTLKKGIKEFKKFRDKSKIDGKTAASLYQTYGFPIELIEELANENGQEVDVEGFFEEMKRHQELSRKLSAGVFKSGLSDGGRETTKLHTATHLLHYALKSVLGDNVYQKGSNITSERLRFDFSYDKKMTKEEIESAERIVNKMIEKDLLIKKEELSLSDAKRSGALHLPEENYPENVLVYSFSDSDGNILSREICSGPHVERTSELGRLVITKEESSAKGVRRIRAILK